MPTSSLNVQGPKRNASSDVFVCVCLLSLCVPLDPVHCVPHYQWKGLINERTDPTRPDCALERNHTRVTGQELGKSRFAVSSAVREEGKSFKKSFLFTRWQYIERVCRHSCGLASRYITSLSWYALSPEHNHQVPLLFTISLCEFSTKINALPLEILASQFSSTVHCPSDIEGTLLVCSFWVV